MALSRPQIYQIGSRLENGAQEVGDYLFLRVAGLSDEFDEFDRELEPT